MPRYIDADALIDDLMERYCKECNKRKGYSGKFIYEIGEAPCRACDVDDAKMELECAPTADVAEVVRCKDCKHNPNNSDDDDCPFVEESGCYVKYFPEDDGFCKWGERREDVDTSDQNT